MARRPPWAAVDAVGGCWGRTSSCATQRRGATVVSGSRCVLNLHCEVNGEGRRTQRHRLTASHPRSSRFGGWQGRAQLGWSRGVECFLRWGVAKKLRKERRERSERREGRERREKREEREEVHVRVCCGTARPRGAPPSSAILMNAEWMKRANCIRVSSMAQALQAAAKLRQGFGPPAPPGWRGRGGGCTRRPINK